nr:MAG TPA: hypothetical protein [Caudoviricetes sp.]
MRKRLRFDYCINKHRPWIAFGIGFINKWHSFVVVFLMFEFRIDYDY